MLCFILQSIMGVLTPAQVRVLVLDQVLVLVLVLESQVLDIDNNTV